MLNIMNSKKVIFWKQVREQDSIKNDMKAVACQYFVLLRQRDTLGRHCLKLKHF